MSVNELNKEQLVELKQAYMTELVNEGTYAEIMGTDNDEPSFGELLAADMLISDEFIKDYYSGYSFTEDDFAA